LQIGQKLLIPGKTKKGATNDDQQIISFRLARSSRAPKSRHVDLTMHRKSAYFLFLAVLVLLVIGIVMLFSTSAFARDSHGDVYSLLNARRSGSASARRLHDRRAVDYHFWRRTWWLWFALALITLTLCFVPHFGMRINGSRRWSESVRLLFNRPKSRS